MLDGNGTNPKLGERHDPKLSDRKHGPVKVLADYTEIVIIRVQLRPHIDQPIMKNKSVQFQQFKRQKFEQLSQDRAKMFNFFLQNNDIFGFIDQQDEQILHHDNFIYQDRASNSFFGTLIGVFLVDQVALRFLAPNFRIKSFRPLVFLFKYGLLPCLGYSIMMEYFMDDLYLRHFNLAQKYNFGFMDFQRAMRIWDRAERVGRLEELLEKRDEFDWTGVPELPASDYAKYDM